MEYTIKELAQIAGITTRTLRWYDQIGLLIPARINENGYRLYGSHEIDRLQEILLYRAMGIPLKDISPLLSRNDSEREQFLTNHLSVLKQERSRLDTLIQTVEKTITAHKGGYQMSNEEKFNGFKREILEENERKYGDEIRKKYGNETIEKSNQKWLHLTEEEYNEMQVLSVWIEESLEKAVLEGKDPAGETGREIFEMHKKWLNFTWNKYTTEAHAGVVKMYVSDERFTAYYDKNIKGCTQFLRDAVLSHIDLN